MGSIDEPDHPDRPLLPRLHRPLTISVTIVCYVLLLVPLVGLGEPSLTVLVLLIGAALVPALVLIWRPASSLFIAEATAARRLAVEQRRLRKGRQ